MLAVMTFPASLKAYRRNARLTQQDIAKSLGVSETCVYYWETGQRRPDMTHVAQLERLLNADPGALLVPLAYGEHT